MAASCSSIVYGVQPISPRTRFKTPNLSNSPFQSLSSSFSFDSSSKFLLPKLQISGLRRRNSNSVPIIFNAQSKVFQAIQTVFKVGKDGVEAGTNLVPDAVPRPVARLSVTVVAAAVSLFVLRSFVSTVFFALGFMGFVYFIYLAFNKDKGPRVDDKPGSTDEAIEEAKKIMDKYK
ncbi:uncharacterized protein LOC110728097 [Chenopodium quinoa]|uniref:uncharacterized protein LOC110728097 n=1 Tax=Chenopodium quinoa TaxID=63459 RepID=UPI000B77DE66|nr:uncharacterized protein LOC110728097 [Chenopodium quinoa]XP_021763426.1 uncharacterized protein LOC110728097 [Chenopodium quinoa]